MKHDNRCKGDGSGLLHNMFFPPRTQIQHRSPYRRPSGPGLIFALPENIDARPERLLLEFERQTASPVRAIAERKLRERINAHALTLPFPPAALVTDRAENGDERCTDLLSIITVLAKSSGHVYLRDKEPNLAQVRPERLVILLFPSLA